MQQMEPLNIRFGGGAAETTIHPVVLGVLILSIALIIGLRIKYLVVPFLLTVLMVPLGQEFVIGGTHFTVMRIMIVLGLLRCASAKRWSVAGGFGDIDKAFLLWAFSYALAFVLLYMEAQALVNRLGFLVDAVGGYLLLRLVVRDIEDAQRVINLLVIVAAAMAVCMIREKMTKSNLFGMLGGVSATPDIRAGVVRCQGAFQHSLLAGSFGATSLPLFVGLWRNRRFRTMAMVGVLSAMVIVVTASGSTPVVTCAAGIVGLAFWSVRKWMRAFRWLAIGTLLALNMVMKAPVWALISRIDLTGSSSSSHRYQLVDNFIRHFSDWWLIGTKTYDKWGVDMWDMSNQFVQYGSRGGLATLVCFLFIIGSSFSRLGRARKRWFGQDKEWFLWCLGASLFAHIVAYFGVSYFDQIQVVWYALLAMIVAAARVPVRSLISPKENVTDIGLSSGLTLTDGGLLNARRTILRDRVSR
jgi:hypothetical protein